MKVVSVFYLFIIARGVDFFFSFFFFRLDVMQVAHHYFENGITYFTRRINRCISTCALSLLSYLLLHLKLTRLSACANGEVAPFMGHNAYNFSQNSYDGKPFKTPSSLIRSIKRKRFGPSPMYLKISIWPSDSS
jgi:hypothetical protein